MSVAARQMRREIQPLFKTKWRDRAFAGDQVRFMHPPGRTNDRHLPCRWRSTKLDEDMMGGAIIEKPQLQGATGQRHPIAACRDDPATDTKRIFDDDVIA